MRSAVISSQGKDLFVACIPWYGVLRTLHLDGVRYTRSSGYRDYLV